MSTSLRHTAQQMSQEKLDELKRRRNMMNDHFNPILKHVESADPANALLLLYQAVKSSPVKDIIGHSLVDHLNNILKNVKEKLKREIQNSLKKCEYSYLYGSLLREWATLEEKTEKRTVKFEKLKPDTDESVDKTKSQMFTPPSSDEFKAEKFRRFLSDELLSFEENVEGYRIMREIRRASVDFAKIGDNFISSYDVQSCIKDLSTEKRLSPEKETALNELNGNCESLDEVASILTVHLRNFKSWNWSSSCEVVELWRGLSGEEKSFMSADIITTLFLQYVGAQWASHFKAQFMQIYESKVFAKVFWNNDKFEQAIETKKKEFHRSTFLSCLPDPVQSLDIQQQEEFHQASVVGEENASLMSFIMKAASKLTQKIAITSEPPKPDIDLKQAFLHTLSTEINLHRKIRQDKPLVVVQADFESFGPSVVHDAALIALEYFGVPKEWLQFFKKFLQPRISIAENQTPRLVVRGVSTSQTLSLLFRETLLFLLDLLVNQKCNGMKIYRIPNEFWFWDDVTENVTKAWETMNTYGKMVGLKINEGGSGSVMIYSKEALTKLQATNSMFSGPFPLPRKSIRWGYLQLHSDGKFKIDRKAVKKFLDEMRTLLNKSECVLEWINVFNKYIERFVRNFGNEHLDLINCALRMIYSCLFGSVRGNPVEKLKAQFVKLREADIVDVWVYLPLERGGLGLVNPFIQITTPNREPINEEDCLTRFPLKDKELWQMIVEENVKRYGKIEDPRCFPSDFINSPTAPT